MVLSFWNSRFIPSFIYGGHIPDSFQHEGFDEIFILSLPAFKWLQVKHPASQQQILHNCHLIGECHLLSVGGILYPGNMSTIVTFEQKLGLFDISSLNLTEHYNAIAAP